jgi:signal transduction histidine kinase/DNA-binding response OmpR family regulator
MKSLATVCLLLTIIPFHLPGQERSMLDSLENQLTVSSDTAKISIYHQLSEKTSYDLPTSVAFEEKALALAVRLNDRERISGSLSNIGSLYKNQSEYRKAIPYFKQAIAAAETPGSDYLADTFLELGIAYLRITSLDSSRMNLLAGLEIAKKTANKKTEAGIYNSLGNVFKDENNFKAAVEYYLKATDLFQHLNDKAGMTQTHANVGNVQSLMGNYEKALAYALQSLQIAKDIDKKSSIAYSNRLLGRIYRKIGKFDEAIKVYDEAIRTYQSINARRDASETYLNKGNIYFEKSEFDKALEQYSESLKIARILTDTANMVYSYSAMGMAFDQINDHRLAFRYLDSALIFSIRMNMPHITMDIHEGLSQLYAEEHNYKSAYDHQLLFAGLRDSLLTIQNIEDAKELEAKYQAEKKEQEIQTLNAQNELKAFQLEKSKDARNYLIAFVILCIILIAVIFNRYRIKQKTALKLEELDQIKSRFFTNISHEFRTPLSLILGPLQRKIEKVTDEHEKSDLQIMQRSALRLQNLINQLLDLSKLEAGHMKLNVSRENVRHFFGAILSSFSSLAEFRGIEYRFHIEDHEHDVYFDRDKVEKIVYNLVHNALKFTDVGGKIDVGVKQHNHQLIISVHDNGVGIPDTALPRIFNRFYQVDDSYTRGSEGTGIGLALSKELASLHHGTLTVSSKAGEGSCFTLSIPIHRNIYKADEILPETVHQEGITVPVSSVSTYNVDNTDATHPLVLIVEDHPDMSLFIATILSDQYRVAVAKDGEEGWSRSLELIPDIIISDLMMPKLDGRALCENVKKHEATSHIPVIILTARADQPSKIQGLETGADDYLIKPFDAHELKVRVGNLIVQRQKLRELFRTEIVLAPKNLQVASPNALFLNKIVNILEAHYENSAFGVEEFTLEVGLSRMQLHRKLKSLIDKSPGEFIRQFRLDRAKQLLRVKGMSVSEVSYQTGFNNLSNFTKVFKEYTGVTPSEFAASHAEEIPQGQN